MIWFALDTWPFGSAWVLMVAIFFIEGAGLLFGVSPSGWCEGLMPDLPDSTEGPLGWLHLGQVPMLVLLGIFLSGFSISGYFTQACSRALLGTLLPAWLAAIPAALVGVACVRLLGSAIARVMPSDESSAVSETSLIGRVGVVVQGVARSGNAAQMKLRDVNGRTHYVLVEPDLADQIFEEGSSVLLVKKVGARYLGIHNPHPDLI